MNTHFFSGSALMDDDLCLKAHQICKNKSDTKKHLAKNNVAVPKGKQFDHSISDQEILSFAESFGFPLVLKPTDGYQGKGVFANIKNLESLEENLFHVRHKLNYKDIIIEERIEGNDFRILVIDNRVVASLKRVPSNITGNGIHSIKKLIKNKNLERRNTILLRKAPIIIDKEVLSSLKSLGYNLNSIPKKGEKIFLRDKCNVSAGGDPMDVTENVPDCVKDLAIKAIKSVPGLQHGGVDILFNVDNPDKPCVVIEINSTAMVSGHLYPLEGKPREVIADLVDYYFPESIPNKGKNKNLFFDFDDIRTHFFAWREFGSILNNGTKTEVTLIPPAKNNVVASEIILSGKVQNIGFRSWIQNQAKNLNLFGFTENIKSDKVKIVVAGEEEMVKSLTELCKTGPSNARVEDIVIKETNKPVYLGFYVKLKMVEYLRNEMKIALRMVKQRIVFSIKQKKIFTSNIW
jgi:cyanophycin synthetase